MMLCNMCLLTSHLFTIVYRPSKCINISYNMWKLILVLPPLAHSHEIIFTFYQNNNTSCYKNKFIIGSKKYKYGILIILVFIKSREGDIPWLENRILYALRLTVLG